MFDMMKMMGKLKEVQSKMKIAQEELENLLAEGESGAGVVKASVNGNKKLVALDIDPSLLNAEDGDMMKDLIIAAVNKATEAADAKAKEHMKSATDGMIPNIPGMDLNGMI